MWSVGLPKVTNSDDCVVVSLPLRVAPKDASAALPATAGSVKSILSVNGVLKLSPDPVLALKPTRLATITSALAWPGNGWIGPGLALRTAILWPLTTGAGKPLTVYR